jgi:hypothetical protein
MSLTPASAHAATIASASSRSSAIGFSRKTCLPACDGDLAVRAVGRADVHRGDARVVEDAAVVLGGHGDVVLARDLGRAARRGVGGSDDRDRIPGRGEPRIGSEVQPGDEAAADEPDADHDAGSASTGLVSVPRPEMVPSTTSPGAR